jgi:hypothetical protein
VEEYAAFSGDPSFFLTFAVLRLIIRLDDYKLYKTMVARDWKRAGTGTVSELE